MVPAFSLRVRTGIYGDSRSACIICIRQLAYVLFYPLTYVLQYAGGLGCRRISTLCCFPDIDMAQADMVL